MTNTAPNVIVVAGPNGSGKSTAAPALLRDYMGIVEFVNADVIAQGLSGFGSEAVAMRAGRIMLERLKELAERQIDFAFETTLASRSFATFLKELQNAGYSPNLIFLWLPSPEMAIARVASRVQHGGHFVADETVRHRYYAGLKNFFHLYQPIVDSWAMFDNCSSHGYQLIASQIRPYPINVANKSLWTSIEEQYK